MAADAPSDPVAASPFGQVEIPLSGPVAASPSSQVEASPDASDALNNDEMDYTIVVDWERLQLEPCMNDIPISEDDMFDMLGLRNEESRGEDNENENENEESRRGTTENEESNRGAMDNDANRDVNDQVTPLVVCDKENPLIALNSKFPSMAEFRLACKQFAILEEFEFSTEKSDKNRYRIHCKAKGCPWKLVGRTMADGTTVRVTLLVEEHICDSTCRTKTKMTSKSWVAERAIDILRNDPNMGASDLQKRLEEKYKVKIAYDTVWKGRDNALLALYGKWENGFRMLYNFKAEAELRSPGSVVEIDTHIVDGKVHFLRFFCAFKPCIDGFLNGCRPYMSIDSTALNGKWNGHLCAASGVDGHDWMFPICFGLIKGESEEDWTWFMNNLKRAIGDPSKLAVCTDACKGLEKAVKLVFPQVDQRECHRHLMGNFHKKFQGGEFGGMYNAAYTYRRDVYERYMAKILGACPAVEDYLNTYHNLHWMRCMFDPDIKVDYVNNNLAESFNSWIKGVKDLPPVDLADRLREKVMILFKNRRLIGERLQGKILPAVIQKLKARTRGLSHLQVKQSNRNIVGEVWDNSGKQRLRHVVKTKEHKCTCNEWQHTGKPCNHALALLTTQRDVNYDDYVHEYYSVARFRAAYASDIEPFTDKSQWPGVHLGFELEAPVTKRLPGRQRKNRFKGCLEAGGSRKPRNPDKCKKCGVLGHRQAGCPTNGVKKRKYKKRTRTCPAEHTATQSTPKRRRSMPVTNDILCNSPGVLTRRQTAAAIGSPIHSPAASPGVRTRRQSFGTPPPATFGRGGKKLTPKRKKN